MREPSSDDAARSALAMFLLLENPPSRPSSIVPQPVEATVVIPSVLSASDCLNA